jgi:hypothetical protein
MGGDDDSVGVGGEQLPLRRDDSQVDLALGHQRLNF